MFQLNQIADNKGAHKSRMRVGRGIGSGKGKTCGRGVKGQTSRTGVAIKGFEGGQMPLHRRLPKRGFTSIFKKQYAVINIGKLQAAVDAKKIDAKKTQNYETLLAAGLIKKANDGLRVLGSGELKAGLTLEVSGVTQEAQKKIEAAGGKIELIASNAQAA